MGQIGYGQFPGAASAPPPTYGGTLPPTSHPPEAYPQSSFPSTVYPSGAPSSLFPGGMGWGGHGMVATPLMPGMFRLMQGPRIRHGWLRGGSGSRSLDINETDLAVSFAFPNFGYFGQPIYVSPGFGLNLLRGPDPATGADLPNQVYSGYLDTQWRSDPNRIFSVDLALRVGMYSDFDTNIGDSLRILGRGVGHFRLTPHSTFKGGVYYLDRNRIKLLPAVGILYTPHAMARWDLFFPEPKVSRYFTTLGTQDMWSYVGAEYGGGSWTVRRQLGQKERVDINDIRIVAGLEWGRNDLLRAGQRTGFLEIGYVFDRELVYKRTPADNLRLNDTFMLRLGIGY